MSTNNSEILELIESAAISISLDDHEPVDYSEVAQRSIDGDYHSRWCDKGSSFVVFRNGKFGCIGEHSLYDGSISVSYSFFILLSLLEAPEPDWDEDVGAQKITLPKELKFQIDQKLRDEVMRMDEYCNEIKNSINVTCDQFEKYGKNFMKAQRIHPDAYIQTILQWTYYKLHGHLASTYETATTRVYYHGRTETVRSCSVETVSWIEAMNNPGVSVVFLFMHQ